jgi:AraC-like DNA-binding protein
MPVVGLEDEYPPGFIDKLHTHRRSQLLYASSGVMSAITPSATFVIPPQRALWIPAGVAHEVSCRGHVSLRTLYFDGALPGLSDWPCRVTEVSDFLKALIIELARLGSGSANNLRRTRIADLLVDELLLMPVAPFHAQMPRDPRLLRVCKEIVADPADQRDLDELARVAGMGRRTFTRLFRAQTGTGLAVWRQQIRLMQALSLLAAGKPIASVAYDIGYESPSGFTSMFHRAFGLPPRQYQLMTGARGGPPHINIGPPRGV